MASYFQGGIILGVMIELLTGMGTAFGLGMYLPLQYTLMFVTDGAAKDYWKKKKLDKKVKS